jgi:excisionase family DNA binding protein
MSDQSTIHPEWLDSRQAAALFGVHHKTLERKARRGEIPGYFRFRRWFFVKEELAAWLHDALPSHRQSLDPQGA